ncbi:MAG TPA: GHKL domain-containing protein [Thermoplasmatales archaeon]|nr:GHKL domain-containing protein [Thermoplasmatales archaeon]
MQQVFLNLINNAAAAIKETGVLEIKTSLDANQEKVLVMVRDSGHGIPKEDMDKIFDPFFTTKMEGEGTGLGLFVSHGIISKYEGSITCESSTVDSSKKPRGTMFTVALKVKR